MAAATAKSTPEDGTPLRYVPLHHVYSATSPTCSGSSALMSKKVKARKLSHPHFHDPDRKPLPLRPPVVRVYTRRPKRLRSSNFFDSVLSPQLNGQLGEIDVKREEEGESRIANLLNGKKRRIGSSELVKLGVDSSVLQSLDGPRLRDCRNNHNVSGGNNDSSRRKKRNSSEKAVSCSDTTKKWQRLSCRDADPKSFTGLQCKVYWPLDADWYSGKIVGYNPEDKRHQVEYTDGDRENLIISNEKIKFFISGEEMAHLNLKVSGKGSDDGGHNYEELVVLAAGFDDWQGQPGDIIWAKLTGYAIWPAIVVEESLIGDNRELNKSSGDGSVPVQFFGTYDFARIKTKQIISFLKGIISSYHLKCKKPRFVQSLEEAKRYLNEQKLPRKMLWLQNGIHGDDSESTSGEDEENTDSDDDYLKDAGVQKTLEGLRKSPCVIGDLKIITLGKIVRDSEYFRDDKFIWPEGYTAVRKFTSITDPDACSLYKMEVLRDADSKTRPLFRVTLENGEQFKGHTPCACWNKIYKRIKKTEKSASVSGQAEVSRTYRSGSEMFGFSNPKVLKLIQGLSKSRLSKKFPVGKSTSRKYRDLPAGYIPVNVNWKDLDKCNVCHMDEEYENNLFLQCDKCRMMVHARCYGELEPVGGALWQCNMCRPGAPDIRPPCCLCPVVGGVMKPTSDGRWAHLACAIWIPETCLSDVKRMEPIDGLSRINKDRWKLLCSICGVSYGACIQCSNNTCRVAYHPLCARLAGFCAELEDDDFILSVDEDEENQCIRLLSFCKKHRHPSNGPSFTDDQKKEVARLCSDYNPPPNPSGCARTEPYNYFGRRGRKEPEALAAASLKRLFVENRPYLVGGYSQHDLLGSSLPSKGAISNKFSLRLQRLRSSQLDAPNNIVSMAEKYKYMRETIRKRLAFGKSGIHGFGIFAKHPHRAGDMVIEYTGELVRPSIADRREHLIYNSLVGAGTYMFRIDDERVIDATRAGSIAHLINHSCEPNCYSRVISVNGDEHIIIFAKRDIKRWEELTYDYRFFSIDEQLSCYCGFPRCRGIVNDVEAEELAAKLHAPRRELIDWNGE